MKRRAGQFFNGRALREASRVWRCRGLAVPHERAKNIGQIDFEALRKKASFVIFDKDNTLTLPYETRVHASVGEAFEKCKSVFGRDNLVLFSNSAGSPDDVNHAEATMLEMPDALGIPVLRHEERKPGGGADVKRLFGEHRRGAVIGDRYFTDIVFANLNGHYAILVEPMDVTRDNPVVRLMRWMEARLVERWIRAGEKAPIFKGES